MTARRALLLGHFSTMGDIECLEVAKGWLSEAGIPFDISAYSRTVRAAIPGAIDCRHAEPLRYSHLLVVCGPCWPHIFKNNGFDIERYAHCQRIGVNLTMIEPLAKWNPFDALIKRDSDAAARPDLASSCR